MDSLDMAGHLIRRLHQQSTLVFVQRTQEILRRLVALPPAVQHDPPSVGQHKARHIDRVRIGMLRQTARATAIYVAAAIGAKGLDLDDFLPEIFPRRRLHRMLRPSGEIFRQRTGHRAKIGRRGPDVEELHRVDRAASAAMILVGQRRKAHPAGPRPAPASCCTAAATTGWARARATGDGGGRGRRGAGAAYHRCAD